MIFYSRIVAFGNGEIYFIPSLTMLWTIKGLVVPMVSSGVNYGV